MGVYDYLKGRCPKCGEEIGSNSDDIQVKWFPRIDATKPFRTFIPGDKLPIQLPDGDYITSTYPCKCNSKDPLLAQIRNNCFLGFTRTPEAEIININPDYKAFFSDSAEIEKLTKQNLILPLKLNKRLHILKVTLIIELIIASYYYLNKYNLITNIKPDNVAGAIILGILSSGLFAIIAFLFAISYGDEIIIFIAEIRRFQKWKPLSNICLSKLRLLLNKCASKISYLTGINGNSNEEIFKRISSSLLTYVESKGLPIYRGAPKDVIDYPDFMQEDDFTDELKSIISSLPNIIKVLKPMKDNLDRIQSNYADSLPTDLRICILSNQIIIEQIIETANEAGGQKEPSWMLLQTLIAKNDKKVKIYGFYDLYYEDKILRLMKSSFELLLNLQQMSSIA